MKGTIELKQYDGSQILPKDDAILYDMIVGQNGIIDGCKISWIGGNQIHISHGYGIIKGRLFEVLEQTIYAALPTSQDSTFGYVIISVKLYNTNEPIKIETRIYNRVATEDDWVQEERMNMTQGMWEMPIAEYMATNTGINSFVDLSVKVTSVYDTIKNFSELEAIEEEGYLVDAKLQKKQILTFYNKSVLLSSWKADPTYSDFPYRAIVSCSGVDTNYIPYVTFGAMEAMSGTFAPIANTESNKVYLYANAIPENDFTIPTIQCIRKVG